MKLKQIESILKPNKNVMLYTTEAAQWIGDGAVMYPIYGLPTLTPENILVMWDVPEDKREKWNFRYGDNLDFNMFSDTADEQVIERDMTPICINGAVVEPLATEQGALFINQRYLNPFDDLENGYTLYSRTDRHGCSYISPEYELPCSDGFYEIIGICRRSAVTWFDSVRGVFLPVGGVIGVIGWRQAVPDEADIEEFRIREREAQNGCRKG